MSNLSFTCLRGCYHSTAPVNYGEKIDLFLPMVLVILHSLLTDTVSYLPSIQLLLINYCFSNSSTEVSSKVKEHISFLWGNRGSRGVTAQPWRTPCMKHPIDFSFSLKVNVIFVCICCQRYPCLCDRKRYSKLPVHLCNDTTTIPKSLFKAETLRATYHTWPLCESCVAVKRALFSLYRREVWGSERVNSLSKSNLYL